MRDETLDTTARGRGPGRFAAAIALAAVAACGIPDDPRSTTREVLEQGALRAGVSEAPPWLVRLPGGGADGVEADLIRGFARELGVRVDWRWGSLEEHFRALESYRLHLVAGDIRASSPWKSRVSLTAPYAGRAGRAEEADRGPPVFAVPPGENAWLTRVETYLLRERPAVEERLRREPEP